MANLPQSVITNTKLYLLKWLNNCFRMISTHDMFNDFTRLLFSYTSGHVFLPGYSSLCIKCNTKAIH